MAQPKNAENKAKAPEKINVHTQFSNGALLTVTMTKDNTAINPPRPVTVHDTKSLTTGYSTILLTTNPKQPIIQYGFKNKAVNIGSKYLGFQISELLSSKAGIEHAIDEGLLVSTLEENPGMEEWHSDNMEYFKVLPDKTVSIPRGLRYLTNELDGLPLTTPLDEVYALELWKTSANDLDGLPIKQLLKETYVLDLWKTSQIFNKRPDNKILINNQLFDYQQLQSLVFKQLIRNLPKGLQQRLIDERTQIIQARNNKPLGVATPKRKFKAQSTPTTTLNQQSNSNPYQDISEKQEAMLRKRGLL